MTRYTGRPDVGDVLVTREGPWWVSDAIRLAAWLRDRPAVCNHVIVVHHRDANGTLWGIEGRPGGVGWRDLTGPSSWPLTNANTLQFKTPEQRDHVAWIVQQMLGTPYDWAAITEDGREALHWAWSIPIAAEWHAGEVPGHVVCSSLADYAYQAAGLPNPGGSAVGRFTTPGDWDLFIEREQWGRAG